MKEILKTYQTKLTNLSAGNKSLLQLRPYKNADLDLHDFNFLSSEPSIKIVEQLLQGKAATLCAQNDPRSEAITLCSKRVHQVQNQAKFIQTERGSDDLYLGYPFVEGKLSSGFALRCPLLFIPIKIVAHKNLWQVVPNGESIKFNKSFLLAYAHYTKTKLDLTLDELELDFTDLRSFLLKLYELLKASTIELNFNTELFEEHLSFFTSYKKQEFEGEHKEGVLKLQPYAVLGIYPQAGSELHSDYESLIESCTHDDLEAFFASKSAENLKVKEESLYTPFPIDASQEEALKMLREGKSIVVQGPPGTGKSQLIAQVVADYLANGKKVLLACDKRVALDVVYDRLNTIALAAYVGLVHDYNTDRKHLYEKISSHIEKLEDTQKESNSYQTIALERDFLQTSRRITQIEEELDAFKKALFQEMPFGVSVKYLYLNIPPKAAVHVLSETEQASFAKAATQLNYQSFKQLLSKLNYWLPQAAIFEQPNFALKDRKSYRGLSHADAKRIYNAHSSKNALFDQVSSNSLTLYGSILTPLAWESLLVDQHKRVKNIDTALKEESDFEIFVLYATKKLSKDKLKTFVDKAIPLLQQGILYSTDAPLLERAHSLVTKALAQLSRPLGRLRYYLSYKHKEELATILHTYKTPIQVASMQTLLAQIVRSLEYAELVSKIKKQGFVFEQECIHQEEELRYWEKHHLEILNAIDLLRQLPEGLQSLYKDSYSIYRHKIQRIYEQHAQLPQQLDKLREALSAQELLAPSILTEVQSALDLHFDTLVEYDRFTENFNPYEHTLARFSMLWQGSAEAQALQLKRGVYQCWIDHIEESHGVLRSASTGYLHMLEEELQSCLQHKQQLSKDLVQLRAKENFFKNIVYNRLGNRTTYRDLYHETTKKKRIKPVRQLFEEHQEEILQLIPCWMASPETVAAVFPNTEIFDLVVFDEASQCYTEEAMPALFRGKQVLVAGDSKQLAPSNLYKPRWEDEDESIDEQTHALLDLACRYLPQLLLREHYRSLSHELIQFSNEKFYHGKLRLVPHRDHFNSTHSALTYVQVYGVWQDYTNYLEALECVRLIQTHLYQDPQKTIGVITFNFKQQELIQELLLQDSLKQNYTLPDTLFIKNIENVQGDERDIIIFSIAYAPNPDGKMVSNFGSLALSGGENRLNVAITRAREKMYVITSILPQQLDTDTSKNPGPSLLKEYLQYAWTVSQANTESRLSLLASPNIDENTLKAKLQAPHLKLFHSFADLLEVQAQKAIAALITDDDLYYQSRSAKEIHGYVPYALRTKGWKVEKLYSREYYLKLRV